MWKRRKWLAAIVLLSASGGLFLKWGTRLGYESAAYTTLETEGPFEIRDYPEMTLVTTPSNRDMQGRDGSFSRLFRYISGENQRDEKIAMTTPVLMTRDGEQENLTMGFVVPRNVSAKGAPVPSRDGVKIRQRSGGRFAVVRFSGQLNRRTTANQEQKLRDWLTSKGLIGDSDSDSAGYDPPFTPGFLRRNEVLIRLQNSSQAPARS